MYVRAHKMNGAQRGSRRDIQFTKLHFFSSSSFQRQTKMCNRMAYYQNGFAYTKENNLF